MNSKEALEEIKDWLEYKDADWATVKYVEKIEKDLEVLEILKHLIHSIEETFNSKTFHESGMMGTHIKDYFIDNDITGKVKEWLNDK